MEGQRLRAAGRVKSKVELLTPNHVSRLPRLWEITKRWYKYFPSSPDNLHGEQIIFYELREGHPPLQSPQEIRPRPGDKFIPLHPNCEIHKACGAYPKVDEWWRDLMC